MSAASLTLGAYAAMGTMLALPAVVSVPVSVQMITLATLVIFAASFHAAERERARQRDGDDAEPRDVITGKQAYRFPFIASISLFSMFVAFKLLPKEWVSFALTMYGVVFGACALANTLAPAVERIPSLPAAFRVEYGHKDYLSFTVVDIICLILASPVAVHYYRTRSWLANNVLAAALGLSAIDLLALGDFQSGAILLSGLFFYDIFWVFGSKSVFGTNVMVAVAKNFEGPIKLVFPRFLGASSQDMSMLGLGDIVIPGLFIALMLRFDARDVSPTDPLPRRLPYFAAVMCAYVLGLITTVVAMNVFLAAQPALLYLVPACLLTALAMAACKGELKMLWNYSEEDEEEEKGAADSKDEVTPDDKKQDSCKAEDVSNGTQSKKDQ
jgi:minor histocompatibility antigen H13